MLDGFHLEIARIAGRVLEPHGFALGGGYALQAHGVTDRPSKDLDTYTQSQDPVDYQAGEVALVSALSQTGFDCRVARRDSWFRQIVVTDRASGEQVAVDLGYDYRLRPPVRIEGVGPVLDLDDVIVGKTRALLDRQAERDYFDIDRIIASSLRSPSELYEGIRPIRPELSMGEFARVIELAHEGDPEEYVALGLSLDDMLALFERLAVAAQSLRT